MPMISAPGGVLDPRSVVYSLLSASGDSMLGNRPHSWLWNGGGVFAFRQQIPIFPWVWSPGE